mgnify:CR=1 FL=1
MLLRRAIVWAAVAAYAVFFSFASVLRHETFNSGVFDLVITDQAIWSTLHGNLLGISIESQAVTSDLGYHFEPILFLIAPLYWLYDNANTLLIVQSVVVALGALPASWLAYQRLRSNFAAVVFALAYLLFPAVQSSTLFDFHAFTLSAALLLFAFYYLEQRRYRPFALAAVLAMSTRENVPLTVAMMGLYIIAVKRDWRPGLLTVAASTAWFAFGTYFVIPANNAQGQSWLWNRYAGLGSSPLQLVSLLIAQPERLLEPAPGLSNPLYLARLLLPVAYLSLLHPPSFLIAAPGLAANLLTQYEAMHLIETYHYAASLVPVVVISAIYGTGALADALRRLPLVRHRYAVWALSAVVLAASFAYHYYRGYTPLSPSFSVEWPNRHHEIGHRLAASIPAEASVSAQFNLGPHVAHRHRFTMFPEVAGAEYVFLDVASQPNAVGFWEGFHKNIERLLHDEDYGIVAAQDGYLLLRRGAPRRELPEEFFSFARAAAATPQHPLCIRYGDAIELLGFDLHRMRDARVELTLYWRALRPVADDLLLAVFLTDGHGKELGATAQREPVNYWYPVPRWKVGEIVQMRTLRLPWDPQGEEFGLGVGVVAGDDPWEVGRRLPVVVGEAEWMVGAVANGTIAEILTVRNDRGLVWPEWRPRPRGGDRGSALATFGGKVALTGFELAPARAKPGQQVAVRLAWRVDATLERSYTTFVHFLAPGPQVVAQKDSPPLGGRLPTTFWLPGDGIDDEYVVELPATLAPGEYEVEIGLYDPRDGRRLPVAKADGSESDHLMLPARLLVAP